MTKISVNTKIKAVEEYINGNASKGFVSRKYGIAEYDFQIGSTSFSVGLTKS